MTPGMNLMETKKLVEDLPSQIAENMPNADAEAFQKEITEAGGTVELI
jgi:ribosomal protein L7/L12